MAIGNPIKNRGKGADLAFFLIFFSAVFGAIVYFGTVPKLAQHRLVGKPAPSLSFQLDGQELSVEKEKGTVVLLSFWAPWCEPCMEELPSLRMLENHFAKRGFLLLAFNIDEGSGAIRGQLGKENFPNHLIYQFSRESLRTYGVQYIPLSVLVDSRGIIRHVYSGTRNWMDLGVIQEIEELLHSASK